MILFTLVGKANEGTGNDPPVSPSLHSKCCGYYLNSGLKRGRPDPKRVTPQSGLARNASRLHLMTAISNLVIGEKYLLA
jgi:hypothetical protein